MERITKTDIYAKLKRIGSSRGIPITREQAERQGREHYLGTDYYSLPDNPYKWKLCVIATNTGAEWDIVHSRMKTPEFYQFLCGLELNILEEFNRYAK